MEFKTYKDLVKKYYQKDCRELNFQNRVIIPFLESLFSEEYEVVDSSTLYKNWKNYKDENNYGICREMFVDNYTPDHIIKKNWKLFDNKKEAPSIIIEIKRPTAIDRPHANKEIKEYLEKTRHVILTDSITWEFYDKQNENKPEIIHLDKNQNQVCKRDIPIDRKIEWNPEKDWEHLKKKIKELLP